MVALTIGMPTYNDFDGVYFTIQALRLYQDLTDTELLVVDNYGCEHTRKYVESRVKARYILATDAVGTAAAKNRVFAEARGAAVLCCDSHVLFFPDTIARLKAYYLDHPDTLDLLQGPIVFDDMHIATHRDPIWRNENWGIWGHDPRGEDPEGEPFEIPMQGMGVFSCQRSVWPGFNPAFRGFGGEEGYIHEKFRQRGGKCLCLPWLRWSHRFPRPAGVPYPLRLRDKVKNYIIGFNELGLDLEPIRDHYSARLPDEKFDALMQEALSVSTQNGRITPASPSIKLRSVEASRVPVAFRYESTDRRAIVCFVEDKLHLIQQLQALRLSWLHAESSDTDLVVIGPSQVLAQLPDDLIKIDQQPVADDPVWGGYRFVNAIACLNGAGAEQLDRYSHILRTDADTFITPAWNRYFPEEFSFGRGAYAKEENVRERIRAIAADYGLVHRGITNVGSTWYGPTAAIRRTAALAEMLTKHILTHHFADDPGKWPGWYRGVAVRYAGEIAINHCAPDSQQSSLLDVPSTSGESITRYPHIHCWHTKKPFSKHAFMRGDYRQQDANNVDLDIIRDYCLAMSFRSIEGSVVR